MGKSKDRVETKRKGEKGEVGSTYRGRDRPERGEDVSSRNLEYQADLDVARQLYKWCL